MSTERRNFSRVEFKASISLEISGKSIEMELVDISLKGALVQSSSGSSVSKGERGIFALKLDQSEIELKIDSTVVYEKNQQFGLKFNHIDLESMIHLRRLVELNIGNPDKIQQELFFLVNLP